MHHVGVEVRCDSEDVGCPDLDNPADDGHAVSDDADDKRVGSGKLHGSMVKMRQHAETGKKSDENEKTISSRDIIHVMK